MDAYKICCDLFKFPRSLSGPGNRETLKYLSKLVESFTIKSFDSGRHAFDWTVPKEWVIREAYILTPDGKKICNFAENNLHVVGYSSPVNKFVSKTAYIYDT